MKSQKKHLTIKVLPSAATDHKVLEENQIQDFLDHVSQWFDGVISKKDLPRPIVLEFGFHCVSESQMKKLNQTYRSKNYTTDVLSFSSLEVGQNRDKPHRGKASVNIFLGELVLCLKQAQRQAQKQERLMARIASRRAKSSHAQTPKAKQLWSLDLELQYLTLHGFLHLLGFDHEKGEKEAAFMLTLQDSIFSQVTGVPLVSQE